MQELRGIKDILEEAMSARNQTVPKIADSTGIPERFITAFLEGNFQILPAAPYVRGYLKKISHILELDPEMLWERYEREIKPRQSGAEDNLPENRFAIKAVDKRLIAAVMISAAIIIYFGINFKRHFGLPDLRILYPTDAFTVTQTPSIIVKGQVSSNKDLVNINGAEIFVDEFGEFEKEITLDPGTNNIDVVAKRFLGRSRSETIQIIYERPTENLKTSDN